VILDRSEFQPGVPRLSYRGYSEDDLILELLFTSGYRGALVRAEWRQGPYESEHAAENAERAQAFAQVARAFSFRQVGFHADHPEVFYVPNGLVRLPFSASNKEHREIMGISLKRSGTNFQFSLDY
jgi:hypothetical protein